MPEAFRPFPVRPRSESQLLFRARCLFDLQLLTIFKFLRQPLGSCRGRVLDVGAGEAPWRDLFADDVEYVGVDIELAAEFGMRRSPDLAYYDGKTLPYKDGSFDHVLCVEVLEHVAEPAAFLCDLRRVLRRGGKLILTVPWSARIHHLPYDYSRLSRFGLATLLGSVGFSVLSIEERGSDISVIANKLLVLTLSPFRSCRWYSIFPALLIGALLAPISIVFLGAAHIALLLHRGSKADPLGYGVIAVKT